MNKECKKCNKVIKLVDTGDRGSKPTSLFCKSCTSSYGNRGLSLVDEYLQEQFSYYNPKGPYILKCDCGVEKVYTTKYSLVRVLQTTGKCGECSKAMNRKGWTLSEEDSDNRRVNAYNYVYKTNYTSVDQLPEPKEMSRYRDKCQRISQTNLKRERPNDYKLYQENKWDGTDLGQLSIDHIKPLHECFKEGWSVKQASDISNLQLLSMKDNILKEQSNSVFIK
jgi:hypothetical protein